MNKLLIALLFIVPFVAAEVAMQARFDSFLEQYGKSYTGAEYERRLAIFTENHRMARHVQYTSQGGATFGETKFFDMSYEEWSGNYLPSVYDSEHLAKSCMARGVYEPAPEKKMGLPENFDWREKDAVTSVKDQGSCGSCWAFSTAGAIEGQVGIHTMSYKDTSFSPQYIIDCSFGCTSLIYYNKNTTVCNSGCGGGWPWSAMDDIARTLGGVPDWDSVPYEGRVHDCDNLDDADTVAKLSGYTCITSVDGLSEDDLMAQLVAKGPLSIAVDASYFFLYKGGIFDHDDCEQTYLNHAILLVGYGYDEDLDQDYWIVKNSWGEDWGENGYIRMVRGKNMCGITAAVSVPELDSVRKN